MIGLSESLKDNFLRDELQEWYNGFGLTPEKFTDDGMNADYLYNMLAKGKNDVVIKFLKSQGFDIKKSDEQKYIDILMDIMEN